MDDALQEYLNNEAIVREVCEHAMPLAQFVHTRLEPGDDYPSGDPMHLVVAFGPRSQFTDSANYGLPRIVQITATPAGMHDLARTLIAKGEAMLAADPDTDTRYVTNPSSN